MRKLSKTAFQFFFTFTVILFLNNPDARADTLTLKIRLQKAEGEERIGLLNEFARAYLEFNPAVSLQYASRALSLSGSAGNSKEQALALHILADASYYLGNYDNAIDYYLRSASVEMESDGESSEGYINRIGDAGFCYYITDRYAEAMHYFEKSLDLSLREQLHTQAASMYCNIGNIFVVWGDYEKGLEYHRKALEIDMKTGGDEQIATDLNNIGKIYEKWGHYHEAVNFYLESLEISRKLDNLSMIAVRLNNLGYVYKAWGQYPEALDYFQQALRIEQKQGNIKNVGHRLINIAATCLSMKQYEDCRGFLNQALPLIKKAGSLDDLAGYHQVSANLFLSNGEYIRAIDHFQHS